MTILKLQIDSPESGKHSKYLESMSEVSRKNSQSHFQKLYFPQNPFFSRGFAIFVLTKKGLCGKYKF